MIALDIFLVIWGATIFCAVASLICAVVLTIKFKRLTRLVRSYTEQTKIMAVQRELAPPAAVLVRRWKAEYKKAEDGSPKKQAYWDKLNEYKLLK